MKEKLSKILNDKLELYICMTLMSLMTIIIFVQVIMRYVFKNSLTWSEELARYLFVWMVYIGISLGAKQMKHIKIDAALGLFPEKMRPYVVIFGDICFFCFSVFIIITGFLFVQRQIKLGQVSAALHVPLWMIYAAPMVGYALVSIRELQTIKYRFDLLKKGDDK